MHSLKAYFKGPSDDDPGSIESIERARERNKKKERPPTLRDIPKLTKDLLLQSSSSNSHSHSHTLSSSSSSNTASTSQSDLVDNLLAITAAKKLYELCDVGHKSNREPMVASGQHCVIGPLTQCLLHESRNISIHNNRTVSSSSEISLPLSSPPSSPLSSPQKQEEEQQQPKINDDDDDDDDDEIEKKNDNDNNNKTNVPDPSIPKSETTTATAAAAATTSTTTIVKIIDTKEIKKEKKRRTIHPYKDEKLHFVCLTLNNLSIPHDNKRVMVKERGSKALIGNLCKVIASGKKETYLCCIILMNLSFYEPGLVKIGQFSPSPPSSSTIQNGSDHNNNSNNSPTNSPTNDTNGGSSGRGKAKKAVVAFATTATAVSRTAIRVANQTVGKQRKLTPLENPYSLLRILQELISDVERGTSDFRWAFGLLANLSKDPENSLLIGLTGIPRVAIDTIRLSLEKSDKTPSNGQRPRRPTINWKTNSLEDFSLYFLLHLSEICPPTTLKGALEVIIPLMDCDCQDDNDSSIDTNNETGNNHNNNGNNNNNNNTNSNNSQRSSIQSLKATMICAFLGLEWSHFPDHGVIAAGAVSELMGNTFERVGKKFNYTDNDFSLRTAVSAYAALAKAAAKADAAATTTTQAVHTAAMNLIASASHPPKTTNTTTTTTTVNTVTTTSTNANAITTTATTTTTKNRNANTDADADADADDNDNDNEIIDADAAAAADANGNVNNNVDANATANANVNSNSVDATTIAKATVENNGEAEAEEVDGTIQTTATSATVEEANDGNKKNTTTPATTTPATTATSPTAASIAANTTTTTATGSDTTSTTATAATGKTQTYPKMFSKTYPKTMAKGSDDTATTTIAATATATPTVATTTAATPTKITTPLSAITSFHAASATTMSSCVHTKVMALPTSVALLFQIINAIALHWIDDEDHKKNSQQQKDSYYETYHWDIKAGDLAVGAVMSLLPALLEGEKQKYQQNQASLGTQQACADLSKVFVFFSKKTNSYSAKARAMEIAEKLTETMASGRSLPLLEAAYDLCTISSSTHRIQKNFL